MSNVRSMNEGREDSNFSALELARFLRESWRQVSVGGGVGILVALCVVLILPSQYEATAVIQPMTIGMAPLGPTVNIAKGLELESPEVTLARLRDPAFYTDDILRACEASSGIDLLGNIKSSQLKGNSLIQLIYRARSREAATTCLKAIVEHVIRTQNLIAAPLLNTLRKGVALTQKRLIDAELFQSELEKHSLSSKGGESLPVILSLLSKHEEISRLQNLLLEQQMLLSPPLTQEMQLVGPVYTPGQVVAPKKLLILASGLFGGGLAGGLVYYLWTGWVAWRKSRPICT